MGFHTLVMVAAVAGHVLLDVLVQADRVTSERDRPQLGLHKHTLAAGRMAIQRVKGAFRPRVS